MNCGRASVSTEPSEAPANSRMSETQNVTNLPLDDGRVFVAQKEKDLQEAFAPARIDDMVGASQ